MYQAMVLIFICIIAIISNTERGCTTRYMSEYEHRMFTLDPIRSTTNAIINSFCEILTVITTALQANQPIEL